MRQIRRTLLAFSVVLGSAFAADTASAELLNSCAASTSADSGPKVALVIGNSNYPTQPLDRTVPAAVKDATAMAHLLCDKDAFSYVDLVLNARTAPDIREALSRLTRARDQLHPKMIVVYFSGHALSLGGRSYLIPTVFDETASSTQAIAAKSVSEDEIAAALGNGQSGVARILILDACREPAIAAGSEHAVAPPKSYLNYLVAYATPEGQIVSRYIGKDNNSAFTWALLQVMGQKNWTVIHAHEMADILLAKLTNAGTDGSIQKAPFFGEPGDVFHYAGMDRPDEDAAFLAQQGLSSEIGDAVAAANNEQVARAPPPHVAVGGLSVDELLRRAQAALRQTASLVSVDGAGRRIVETIPKPDFALAEKFWERASDLGSVSARRRLGDLYRAGFGVKKSYDMACRLYTDARNNSDAISIERTGDCHRDQRNDLKGAIAKYEEAYRKGFPEAKTDLAYIYLWNPDLADSYPEKQDVAVAERARHQKEWTATPRSQRGLVLFSQVEKEGSLDAADWIGFIYVTGHGAPRRDLSLAFKALQRAADVGDTNAAEYLARVYAGNYFPGVAKDAAKSDLYFHRAAENADAWFIRNYALTRD
jgi:caspase domain-containing protein/Sel1 repeat-containing protein